jgi:TolB-like protein/Tfp pilus assembly protein PilF
MLCLDDQELDDDLVMNLVDQALDLPAEERDGYLETACAGNSTLYEQARSYVAWEQRMNGFLLEPFGRIKIREHRFEPGEMLDGRFRIEREVAEGGMGVVYSALDQKLDRRIAIKCAKAGFLKRLPPEILSARAITHPNVCKIFEIHTTATQQGYVDFLTMELLEGKTLAERLHDGRFTPQEAERIARQLCAGLAEAHRAAVVHGDLKSSNIILTAASNGDIKAVITDFGLASIASAKPIGMPASGERGGTPDYMAPELWRGETPSVVSDVYALGVILCELISGQRPTTAAGSVAAGQGHLNLPAVPKPWERTLKGCLEPDPAQRFQRADQILESLGTRRFRRWQMGAIAAAVSSAAIAIGYHGGPAPSAIPSVAVMPFVNVQHTPEMEFLADGISEGLINALAQLPNLTVIARSSSFKFRGDAIDVRKAARVLAAQAVVTGRIAKMDGRFRVTAELVNGADGIQLWGAQYSAGISDFPAVLADFSRDIALHIRSHLTEAERVGLVKETKTNPEAYEALLRARYQMSLYTPESKEKAVTYYQQALVYDPGFAPAHAGLASAYRLLSASGIRDPIEMIPLAISSANRALAADPDLAHAHLALAAIKKDQWDWAGAEPEYRTAIKLSPNAALMHQSFATFLSVLGRHQEAGTEIARAHELDPIGLTTSIIVASVNYNARQYDRALEALQRAADLDPKASAPWTWMGIVNGGSGRYPAAIAAFEKAVSLGDHSTATQCYYAYALARSGQPYRAQQVVRRVTASGFVPRAELAIAYIGLNQKERAFELLRQAYATRDSQLQYLRVESHFDALNSDPRFQDLVGRVGLPH